MRIYASLAILAIAIGALVLFAGCNSTERVSNLSTSNSPVASKTAPGATPHVDNARRINVQEAQSLIAKGQAVVIDVRNQAAYDQGHIRGAKLIPLNEVAERVRELPRDKTIITYCS